MYWSHDGFIALPDDDNDFVLNIMTYGRDPLSLNDGIYIICARVKCFFFRRFTSLAGVCERCLSSGWFSKR